MINKQIVKEPIMIIPLASPYCDDGWSYHGHGYDWGCLCAEGKSQSPIDISPMPFYLPINKPALFSFNRVSAKGLIAQYKKNLLRIICAQDCSGFGTVTDEDLNEFKIEDMVFHTPSEHKLGGKSYDMEVQIKFSPTMSGEFTGYLAISLLFYMEPGARNKFLDALDLLNLPNLEAPQKQVADITSKTFSGEPAPDGTPTLSLEDFFWVDYPDDDTTDYVNNRFSGFFSYYKYEGSLTSPPCDGKTLY